MQLSLQNRLHRAVSELQPPLWLLLPFAVVAVSDIAITYYALYYLDTPRFFEKNDLAVFFMEHLGATGLLLPYLLGITVWTSLALVHPWRRLAFRVLGVVYLTYATYVVANNFLLVHTYLTGL